MDKTFRIVLENGEVLKDNLNQTEAECELYLRISNDIDCFIEDEELEPA